MVGIEVADFAQRRWIMLERARSHQHDGLIAFYARVWWNGMGVAPLQDDVFFGAGHEERCSQGESVQPLEIHITAIYHVEGSRLRKKLIQDVHVMDLAVSDPNKHGDVSVQIDQRVHLDRAFLLAEASPREHCQAQVDRRRVQCVGAVLEFHTERIVSVEAASALNEDLREVGEDMPLMFFVRIRQCRTGDPATNAHVIQLVW